MFKNTHKINAAHCGESTIIRLVVSALDLNSLNRRTQRFASYIGVAGAGLVKSNFSA